MLAFVLLGVLAIPLVAGQKETLVTLPNQLNQFNFAAGDPRLCMEMDREGKIKQRFEVLPGIGWDNLQNLAKGQVIDYSYTKCQTTDDGRFLVPDQVFTIPIKSSYVDTFAEFIDTWHNTSDTTSSSVNANAGLNLGVFSVSGSFSHEHTQIKKKQIEDTAATTRVQLRYHRYKAQLQPDSQLHKSFKRRLLNIAALLELNQTQMARYEGELIVRDFGTHHLTSVTAGAGLVKTDFLKREYVASHDSDKSSVLASASASYGSIFHAGVSYGHSTDSEDYKSYKKSLTHSYVTSYGGPIMKAFNMSANDWTSGVDMEMVPMDRSGDPLSFLVTVETLPELPVEMVYQVEFLVRKAIIQFYEKNTISGCTKMGSPNFSFSANFDDGSCDSEPTNMTFGGVYQTCQVEGQYLHNNPCAGMTQVNPKTSTFSCPAPYTDITLVTGKRVGKPEYRRDCHSCGFLGWSTCCDTRQFVATAVYTAHWCAGLGNVPQDSGYLFGGFYTDTKQNPITGTKGCPPSFYPQTFLDHHICISDDFELGISFSVPFGGFMSCRTGNPLSTPGVHPVGTSGDLLQARRPPSNLNAFMAKNNNPSTWPNHCPKGYSQHLESIDNGCEVRYCLKAGALSGPNLPKIKLPPFEEKPNMIGPQTTRVMFDVKTQEWVTNEYEYNKRFGKNTISWTNMWGSQASTIGQGGDSSGRQGGDSSGRQGGASSGMQPGVAAVIAVIVTLSCGVVALAAFKAVQRRRRSGGVRKLPDDTQRLTGEHDSGADEAGDLAGAAAGGPYGSTSYQNGDSCAVDVENMKE